MYYLDANAFIYPALYDGEKAAGGKTLLQSVVAGEVGGATAALTIDEVVYILAREEDRETAIAQGRRLLEMPNLRILDVEGVHLLQALAAMETHAGLSPRDAIHYAVMTDRGIFAVVSDDEDFDDLSDVERQPLESFAAATEGSESHHSGGIDRDR